MIKCYKEEELIEIEKVTKNTLVAITLSLLFLYSRVGELEDLGGVK